MYKEQNKSINENTLSKKSNDKIGKIFLWLYEDVLWLTGVWVKWLEVYLFLLWDWLLDLAFFGFC